MDVIYIFEEPSIVLHHPRRASPQRTSAEAERQRQHGAGRRARSDVIKLTNHVVDFGPNACTPEVMIEYEGSYAGHLFNRGNIKA
jgi:excinuclease UvrABC ATPase subunit